MARGVRLVEGAIGALVVALLIFTVLVVVLPTVQPAVINDRLDMAISSTAALIGLSVAGLGWVRYRELRELRSLLLGSAFAVLGSFNLATVLVSITQVEASVQGGLDSPGQLPILSGLLVRLVSVALLVGAGLARDRRADISLAAARATFVLPSVVLLALAGFVAIAQAQLPALLDPVAAERLRQNPTQALGLASGPLLASLQLAVAVGYLAAGYMAFREWQRRHAITDAWLAAGLIIAGFSQVHAGVHPGAYASLVTSADFLRVGFYLALLLGLAAERRSDVRNLRWANIELLRLRDADTARAALQERARLAREIHDGLAQDLWYAKLKQSRLEQAGVLSEEQATLAHEVTDAIDAALAEARHAVSAMRLTDEGPLDGLIEHYVEDYADRYGIRATFEREGNPPTLATRAQVEVLRIVQESLNNVRKHADATTVRVVLGGTSDALVITVIDNGRGFDPGLGDGAGFGMESMRQRAALIGAQIRVDSRPQDGTRLALTVPVPATEPSA
jgi:signal transduction histidine kinase